jgi:hypothetical protein
MYAANILREVVEVSFTPTSGFLQIKETLSRIGITDGDFKLYPFVLLLHKRGKYFLVPYKVMFILDGKETSITDQDWVRYFTIVQLLKDWKLISVLNPEVTDGQEVNLKMIKIIPFAEKNKWTIIPKYIIGEQTNNSRY